MNQNKKIYRSAEFISVVHSVECKFQTNFARFLDFGKDCLFSILGLRRVKNNIGSFKTYIQKRYSSRLVLFAVDYYCAYSANGFFRETFCLDVHYEGDKI